MRLGFVMLVLAGCLATERVSDERRLAEGEKVAAALATRLMAELQAAIAREGAAGAVDFCHDRALALTADIARAHPEVRGLRRIGVRVRQPENAADETDRLAMAGFAAAQAAGRAPAPVLLRHPGESGAESARYYRPLLTAPLCLACHGPVDQIPPPVAETLRRLYPRDAATGFRQGDLRGAIVVEF